MSGQPTEADIAAVLASHAMRERGRIYDTCCCGWYGSGHAAHVAAALRPLLTDTADARAAGAKLAAVEALDEVQARIIQAIETLDPRGSLFHIRAVRDELRAALARDTGQEES